MPSHILPSHNTKNKPPQKKLIKKENKIARKHSTQTTSDCDCADENTMSEITQTQTQWDSLASLKEVNTLLRSAIHHFKYSIDTYMVCLTMLIHLKFEIPQGKVRLMASALLLMAAKVHQFRTPKLAELQHEGRYQFNANDLLVAEAELLKKLDYRIPVVFEMNNLRAIQQNTAKLQNQIHILSCGFQ